MSVSDPIADMLTKIRNASRANLKKVELSPVSKIKTEIVKIFENEGYIANYSIEKKDKFDVLILDLKYNNEEKGIIHSIKSVSTPGRRFYTGYEAMPRVLNGFGTLVVSTSQGVMTGKEAAKKKIGGEIICKIW